jgi:hypothetical protein
MRKTFAFIAAICCLCIFGRTSHAADTLLRMHFKPGDTVAYNLKLDVENNVSQDGDLPVVIPQPFKLAATGTVTLEVVKVNEFDVATLKMSPSITNALLDGKDIAEITDTANTPGFAIAGMLLKGFEFDVDEKSHIMEIRFVQPAAGIDVNGIRSMFVNTLLDLPDDAVKTGGTWSRDLLADLPYFANMIPVGVNGKLKSITVENGKILAAVVTSATLDQKDLKVNLDGISIPGVDVKKLKITINTVNMKAELMRTLDVDKGYVPAMALHTTGDIDAMCEMGDNSASIAGDFSISLQLTEAPPVAK